MKGRIWLPGNIAGNSASYVRLPEITFHRIKAASLPSTVLDMSPVLDDSTPCTPKMTGRLKPLSLFAHSKKKLQRLVTGHRIGR